MGTNNSLISTIDSEKLLTTQIFECSMRSQYFCYFLIRLLKNLQRKELNTKDFILIFDNAMIHKSKESMELLNLLYFQFLALYSPKMNPIEEYFGSFKNKFKCKIFSSRINLVNEIKKQLNFE